MLTRIDLDDAGTAATLEASAAAVTELADLGLMAMVEPFLSTRDGRPGAQPARPGLGDQVDPHRRRSRRHERLHLAQAAGRRRPGAGHGRHHAADAAARRRPARATPTTPTPRGARRSTCRPCAASSSGGRCCSRPTATSPPPSTSPPGSCTGVRHDRVSDNAAGCAARAAAATAFDVAVDDQRRAGWEHTGLHVATLAAGEQRAPSRPASENLVVPLVGSVRVRSSTPTGSRTTCALAGRDSVFAGPTRRRLRDRRLATSRVTSTGAAPAVAVCGARATRRTPPFRHVAAATCPSSCAGPGIASREVRNFGTPGVLDADSIIACEVITPGRQLELVPAAQARRGPARRARASSRRSTTSRSSADGHRTAQPRAPDPSATSGSTAPRRRPIDVLAEVRTGDVVLVPHGWHGPAMARPATTSTT